VIPLRRSGPQPADEAAADADGVREASASALKRGLKNRHIQMIAMGGAIGTGLFYGSADTIAIAGPAVLVTYLIGGAVIFLIMRALGEMSVDRPDTGAFSSYAYRNWSPRAGFLSGWNYWFNYITVSMVELVVVGGYVNYWFPDVPKWLTAAFFLVVVTALNLVSVKAFGEFEFWFALIKIVAVIGMIVVGTALVVLPLFGVAIGSPAPSPSPDAVSGAAGSVGATGALPDLPPPSFAHLVDQPGGFFPFGVLGVLLAQPIVMFSFGGTELIGITAGETEDPKRTIPKAINQVVYRILLFYVCALAVIMAVVPWNRLDGGSSPFVQIFGSAGLPGAAHALNLVVLAAAISVYNSGLYSNGRMLYSLAQQANAPRYLRRVSRSGVPVAGVLTSSAVTAIAVVIVLVLPEAAFLLLISVATIAAIVNWSMIMITQLKFRRRIGDAGAASLAFKLPGGRVSSFVVLAFLALVVVLMAVTPSYQTAVIVGPVWVGVVLLAYEATRRRRGSARQTDAESGEIQ